MPILEKIVELRDEALREVIAQPAFDTVRALDSAVAAAGGERLFPIMARKRVPPQILQGNVPGFTPPPKAPEKVSQGDAAESALRDHGPLPVGRLMEKAVEKGAKIGGDKPLVSFRSMLSKDDRFYSLQRNNMYFWWLKGVDLPEGFMPEPDDISDLLGSGANTNQEGGDGHAANNT